MKNKAIKVASIIFLSTFLITLSSCQDIQLTVEEIIKTAEKMDRKDLYKKAIDELDNRTMYCVGNSSRTQKAIDNFLNYLSGKKMVKGKYVDSLEVKNEFPYFKDDFNGKIKFSQPVNNRIFSLVSSDVRSSSHIISMVLIQDGNQIKSKMIDTGYLLNYIPKDWKGNKRENGEPFALQSLNKVFMYNNTGTKKYNNCWDFVSTNNKLYFMNINSEPVGKNFLYMLTNENYSSILEQAFALYNGDDKNEIRKEIDELASDAIKLGLKHSNAKYSLAYIYRIVTHSDTRTFNDDTPICNELVKNESRDKSGLLVYSKLRYVNENEEASVKNINIAAYQDNYVGIGGYMYKHYLQILKTSPFPWTSCALIDFLTKDSYGFQPWGGNLGGYCSNPNSNIDHTKDGFIDGVNVFPSKNDKGYDWWINQDYGGKLVIENPQYVSSVSYSLGSWINSL